MTSRHLLQVIYCVLIGIHALDTAWCQDNDDCPSGHKCVIPINCKPDEMKLIVGQPKKCDYEFRLNEWRSICCPEPEESPPQTSSYKGCVDPRMVDGRYTHIEIPAWMNLMPVLFFNNGYKVKVFCKNDSTFQGIDDKGVLSDEASSVCWMGRWDPEPSCFVREKCPIEYPVVEHQNLTVVDYRKELYKLVCFDFIDFAWRGHVKNVKRQSKYFYNITFEIETVLKQGIETLEDIKGRTRHIFMKTDCTSAITNPDPLSPYLIMGKDGQEYKDVDGVIRYRYFLDKNTILHEWTSVTNVEDREFQNNLNYVFKWIDFYGCDMKYIS